MPVAPDAPRRRQHGHEVVVRVHSPAGVYELPEGCHESCIAHPRRPERVAAQLVREVPAHIHTHPVGGASRAPCLAIVYMPIWVLLGAPLGRIIGFFCGCYWAIGAGCGAGLSCVPGAATMAPRGLLSMPVPWGCAVLGGCWRGVVSYCVLCSLCCLCERLLTVCTLCSYCVALRRLLSVAAIVS